MSGVSMMSERTLIKAIVYVITPLVMVFLMPLTLLAFAISSKSTALAELGVSALTIATHITALGTTQACYSLLSDKGITIDGSGDINDTLLSTIQSTTSTICGRRYVHIVGADYRQNASVPSPLSGDLTRHAIVYDGTWSDYGQSTGNDGVACWDLDGNGICNTTTEDVNSDGICDTLDCKGDIGATGSMGATGPNLPIGAFSYACAGGTQVQCVTAPFFASVGVVDATPSVGYSTVSTNGTWLLTASIWVVAAPHNYPGVNNSVAIYLEIRHGIGGALIEPMARSIRHIIPGIINGPRFILSLAAIRKLDTGDVLRLSIVNQTPFDMQVGTGSAIFSGVLLPV